MGLPMRWLSLGAGCLALLAGCAGSGAPANSTVAAPGAEAVASDPAFAQPYIDMDEVRSTPLPHRYVHGGFHGTDTRFSFYYPERMRYRGHFFQHVTPAPDNENLAQRERRGEEDTLAFALTHGAYYVETNGGGSGATAQGAADSTITAYRANAAAAQYSRVVAQRVFGNTQRPFGYIYGGSGGGYRSIGAIENTRGVWDGAVPYVIGSTMAIPNVFTVRLHAMRLLWDKFPEINDALDAGGSGDAYATLDAEQKAALSEATRMGFPPQSWFGYRTMGVHGFAAVYPGVLAADPGYFQDFWSKPGYLGAQAPASLTRALVRQDARVVELIDAARGEPLGIVPRKADGGVDNAFLAGTGGDTIAVRLDRSVRAENFLGGDLFVDSGAGKGSRLQLRALQDDIAVFGVVDKDALGKIRPGDQVRVDNRDFLAAQTFHRHQVPGPEFKAWDQFRDAAGKPLYPQRAALVAPGFVRGAAGALPTGKINGKVIVVASLWDREAFPWQADWYRSRVQANLGERTDDNFRLWFTDRALHGDETRQEDPTRTVSYIGVLHQALLDLSAWVERGVPPPASTRYAVRDAQVVVPAKASERQGIQPVVRLTVNGAALARVKAGEPVQLVAEAEAPPGAGPIVEARWDLLGKGDFPLTARLPQAAQPRARVSTTYVFDKPGTYFPTLRVVSQRAGDTATPFARIQNLGRVRVVVD